MTSDVTIRFREINLLTRVFRYPRLDSTFLRSVHCRLNYYYIGHLLENITIANKQIQYHRV